MPIRARIFVLLALFLPLARAASGQTPTPTPTAGPTTSASATTFTIQNDHAVSGVKIQVEPDGSVWFLVPSNDRLVQLLPDGVTMRQWQIRDDKNLGANPVDFEIDGDFVWIVENGESQINAGFSAFGRLDTRTGAFREWIIPGSRPAGLYRAPDGTFWVPQSGHFLQSVDPVTLQVTDYRSSKTFAYSDVTVGPDGALWMVDFGNNRLVRYVPGAAEETSWTLLAPTVARLNPTQIGFDDAGNLWISELSAFRMDRFDPRTNQLLSYGGFQNPYHFEISNGRVYVTEAVGGNGALVVLDPSLASALGSTVTPETLDVRSTPERRLAVVRDTTATMSTFTSTPARAEDSTVIVSSTSTGIVRTIYPSTNGYGLAVTPAGVWVGSEGKLLRVQLQTIGAPTDPTVPLAAQFGVSPGDRIKVESTLFNRGTANIVVDVLYLFSPGSLAPHNTVTVAPGQTVFLADTFESASTNAAVEFGPVRFRVTSGNAADLAASVRTARFATDGSSFGFAIPALASAQLPGSGSVRTLFTGTRGGEVSVFGAYSPAGADATATLVAPDGTVRGTRHLVFAPNTLQEFNPAASAFGVAAEAGDVIRVAVASGSVQAYVNLFDSGVGEVARSLPASASTTGALLGLSNGTAPGGSFVSDLFLANPDSTRTANVTLAFAPSNGSGAPSTATVVVPAGGSLATPDVLRALFSFTGEGTLSFSSDVPVAAAARVASRRPGGDYAGFSPALLDADAIAPGGAASSVGAPQTDKRQTDLLLFNPSDAAATATVIGFDEHGVETGRRDVPVGARASVRIPAVLTTLNGGGLAGRVRVQAAGARIFAATEQIDLGTGDVEVAALR